MQQYAFFVFLLLLSFAGIVYFGPITHPETVIAQVDDIKKPLLPDNLKK